MKKIILVFAIVATGMSACKSNKEAAKTATPVVSLDCSTVDVTYGVDIKPIIESNCTGCHNTNNKAGFNFLELSSVKEAVAKGELLGTIKHQKGFPKMPRYKDKLVQSDIDKIECWIKNGMKE